MNIYQNCKSFHGLIDNLQSSFLIFCKLMIYSNITQIKSSDFVNMYSQFVLIHIFYQKGLDTLKLQLVFLFAFLPKGEYANLACSIISLRLEGNISSRMRYSYLLVFPPDNAFYFSIKIKLQFFISNLITDGHDQFLYPF